MADTELPIDVLHWSVSLLPVLVLLIALVFLRWRAAEAGPLGMFVAAVVALAAFRAPVDTLAVAGAKGVWDAVFILYVVWPALLLYHTLDRAGAFEAFRTGIGRFSRDELFVVLAFGWVFASFLQGIAGFGTPIAVVAPLLVAMGVRPVQAVVVPLIGHAWATMFGTLGVGWLATLQVVDLADPAGTAFQTGLLLWPSTLLAGLAIAWLYGRGQAVRHAAPLVLVISTIQGGGQLLLTLWDPVLAGFLAATAALVALYPLSRWGRYSGEWRVEESPVMEDEKRHDPDEADGPEPVMGTGLALAPYAVLAVVSIAALSIAPVESALGRIQVGVPFPRVGTGYGKAVEAETPYSPFAPLTHPGTFLLIAALAAYLIYRSKGCYRSWADRAEPREVWAGLTDDALPASVAVVAFLVMSKLMDHSGQTEVLALGIGRTTPPLVYAFAANAIGVLGAFMTSSNTASNILFAPLHHETVAAVSGLSEATIIGAQSAGGAIGNVIAPANVVLGTGPAGIAGEEGTVLRKTLPWAALAVVVTGAGTLLLNGLRLTGGA